MVTTSKRENSVHVRLSDEADAVLELMSQVGAGDKSKVAADYLEEALLGKGHAIKVAARRYARLGLMGNDGDERK